LNKILIADDNNEVRDAFKMNLQAHGFTTVEASNGLEALSMFHKEKPSAILMDLKMPHMGGMETLRRIKEIDTDVPVIILTAHGDIQTAVEAIKHGAYDFILKPPNINLLLLTIKRAVEKSTLSNKVKMLNKEVESSLEFLLGHSNAIKKVIQKIHQIAKSDFSLIIQGETGTGKSFIARTIHNLSNRAKSRFVTVDIGSIPETLVESELFGYEKGAFTGAEKRKKGFFEIADGGTILVDELQNLSPYVQSKLLMTAEEKCIYPLGSTDAVKTDVRIIGATNTDIRKAVTEKKQFREDLFYRLNEFMIFLPPLRERIEDIPFLAEKLFREVAEDLDKPINSISDSAMTLLKNHSWPGNIRELKNVLRRAVLLSNEKTITTDHLEFFQDEHLTHADTATPINKPSGMSLAESEKHAISEALQLADRNKTKAASILKIGYATLLRKIKQYKL